MNALNDIPDLSNPETFVSGVPHAAFDRIRATPGLYWQPSSYGTLTNGFWVATRHQDILDIERNPEVFSSAQGFFFPSAVEDRNVNVAFSSHIMMSDAPQHTRLRKAVARSFGPRIVAQFDGWVQALVDETLDGVQAKGDFDAVADIAAVLPGWVIARVLGVPRTERQRIVDLANEMFFAAAKPDAPTLTAQIVHSMAGYMDALRQQKLAQPEDDMASVLAQCHASGEMDINECLSFMVLLVVAGFETTHTAIAQSLRMMAEDAEVARLTDQALAEGRVDAVVEEFLRLVTPAMNMARIAQRDIELGGQLIKKREMVSMMFTAANRDPAVFADPHRFNPWRERNNHLAFGSGPHHCIGNALAKLEMRLLFQEMQRRGLRFAARGTPKRGWSTFINQLWELPLAVVK